MNADIQTVFDFKMKSLFLLLSLETELDAKKLLLPFNLCIVHGSVALETHFLQDC